MAEIMQAASAANAVVRSKRLEDWPLKLRLFLEVMREKSFAWGSEDCCTNACEFIRLVRSEDVYAEFRGKYNTADGARAAIQSVTGAGDQVEDAAAYIAAKFDIPEVPVLFAQRGDVVLFDGTEGQMLGLVSLNPRYSVFLAEMGFISLPTKACRKAWAV